MAGMCVIAQYPTDMTDAEWQILRPLLPARAKTGRPPSDRRRIINGIRYLQRAGCAWRLLPHEYGPWSTVYDLYRRWIKNGLWLRLHDVLRGRVRVAAGRQPDPTAAVLDSQSIKIGDQGGVRGYDAGKKVTGRKRHILVDVLGLLLGVYVGAADQQDRDGAKTLLQRCVGWYGKLAKIWADGGYAGTLVTWVKALRPRGRLHLDIVRRSDDQVGFKVLPRRWVVERTFGWFMKQRRLVRDYETKTGHAEAMLYLAMTTLMLRRLARKRAK
jgi:putative transposase